MGWLTRVRNLLPGARHAADVARELDFHVAELADRLVAEGLPRAEAERQARLRFGHLQGLKEETRAAGIPGWIESVGQDLRYAWRGLRASPGFTATVVVSLALGIGANSAIFSLFNALLLRSLPVERPQELVQVVRAEDGGGEWTNPIWEALRERQDVFGGVFAVGTTSVNLASGGPARFAAGAYVGGDFFPTLGVHPAAGRLLTGQDDHRGCPPVAVLGHGFWQREYGGASSAVGQSLPVNGHPFEIIGVAPRGFFGVEVGRQVDVYLPLCAEAVVQGSNSTLDGRAHWWLSILGRPRDGLRAEAVTARLAALSPGIFESTLPPDWDAEGQRQYLGTRLAAAPAGTGVSEVRLTYRPALLMLLGVVALVLLIACANVANLLLARATTRQHEVAMRLALGASRGRIVRQMLTESLLLAGLGAGLGVLFARWSSVLLLRLLGTRGGILWLDLSLDRRLLAFTVLVAVATGVLFGLVPAWRATRVDPQGAMRAGGRTIVQGGSARFTLGKGLALAQVALALVLVAAAALLLGTFRNLATVNPGFEQAGRLALTMDLSTAGFSDARRMAIERELITRLRAVPGVRRAGAVMVLPVSGMGWNGGVFLPGKPEPERWEDKVSMFNQVSDQYFAAAGTRLLAGRDFGPTDGPGSPPVVIVNEALATKFFGGDSPVGRTLALDVGPGPRKVVSVVGVVETAKYRTLRETAQPTVYLAHAQATSPAWSVSYVLQADGPPMALLPSLSAAVAEVDPGIAFRAALVEEVVDRSLARERLLALLSGFFGGLALLLALIGLYGLMAYNVARRRNEIGIRLALGAARGRVVSMIVGEVGRLVAGGVVVGVAVALAAGRLVQGFLYGVTPNDPGTLAVVTGLVLLVAGTAGAVPAWRASRMDPAAALREE